MRRGERAVSSSSVPEAEAESSWAERRESVAADGGLGGWRPGARTETVISSKTENTGGRRSSWQPLQYSLTLLLRHRQR